MFYEVIIYGRGGQGGVTAASILVLAAMYQGLHAQGFPFFGAERRGAPVMSFARLSDRPILKHGMFSEADVLIVLDYRLAEIGVLNRVHVRDNGYVVMNSPDNYEIDLSRYNLGKSVKIYRVDATKIAIDNKLVVAGWPVVNTSMLGAFARATGLISIDSVNKAIVNYFGGKIGEVNANASRQAFDKTKLAIEV